MQRQLQVDIRAARALFAPHWFRGDGSRLSHDDLADGRIRFERLRAIMPSGQEILFPEDANLPALDIKADLARARPGLEVLLAVPLWAKNRANAFRQGERRSPRQAALHPGGGREMADENTGGQSPGDPRPQSQRQAGAKRRGHFGHGVAALAAHHSVHGRGIGQTAAGSAEFVPPSLLLRSSPALHDMLRELVAQLNASRNDLRIKAATGGLGLEMKWELTLRLGGQPRCGSLPSLVEEGMLPPFAIYLQLRELLGELLAVLPEKTSLTASPTTTSIPSGPSRNWTRKSAS